MMLASTTRIVVLSFLCGFLPQFVVAEPWPIKEFRVFPWHPDPPSQTKVDYAYLLEALGNAPEGYGDSENEKYEQYLADMDNSPEIPDEVVSEIENCLNTLAGIYDRMEFRKPHYTDVESSIFSQQQVFRVYIYHFSRGSPARMVSPCGTTVGIPLRMVLDSDRNIVNNRLTTKAYQDIAHELFHAVKNSYPMLIQNDCEMGEWIREGTAEAVGIEMARRYANKEPIHICQIGLRRYDRTLYTNDENQGADAPCAGMYLDYQTQSFWQFLGEYATRSKKIATEEFAVPDFRDRFFGLAPSTGVFTVTNMDFERIPGIFTPNQQLVDMRKPRLPHEVDINSLGYRNADFPSRKPDDEFRILMVGDSFTYGDFVDNDETLPAQLESALLSNCGGFRVINAGVGGTTIVTHAIMSQRALPLEPDLVILVFSENDIDDLADPLWHSLAKNRQRKSHPPLSIVYPIIRNSALWNFSQELRAKLHASAKAVVPTGTAGNNNHSKPKKLRQEYIKALVELHEFLKAKGIPFVFVVYPTYMTASNDDQRELFQWIVQTAMNKDITTISLLPPLQDSAPVIESYLLPYDGHPSARGHTLAAGHLADQLQQKWRAIFGKQFRCTLPTRPAS